LAAVIRTIPSGRPPRLRGITPWPGSPGRCLRDGRRGSRRLP
jgi:hypothetical protein